MSCLAIGWARAALVGVLVVRHAAADEACVPGAGESARERAKTEYAAGLAAFQDQRYREAIDHLTCANELMESAELAYNIAVTYDAMGDTASALRWFRDYRRQGGKDAESTPVREKVAQLEAELQARGVQQVTIVSTPAGATLRIDEQPMGLTPFTLELKPGRHSYQVLASEHAPVDAMFELRPDRSLDVVVALEPAAHPTREAAPAVLAPAVAAPGPALASAPAPTTEPGWAARVGPWTWVSLGAGTLLLGGAVGVELRRRQLEHELHDVSQREFQDRYDSMSTYQVTARVLFGLGAAALATGGVLFILDMNRSERAPEVALGACSEGGLCLQAGSAF